MRIIHEIWSPMQVGVGSNPFHNSPGFAGYRGTRVELHMSTSPAANFKPNAKFIVPPESETEVIEIEGPIDLILDAFKDAVSCLESTKEHLMKELGPLHALACPHCTPPAMTDTDANASHTWECSAKWSEASRKVIAEDPEIIVRQNRMIKNKLAALKKLCTACGGVGCLSCEWIGKIEPKPEESTK